METVSFLYAASAGFPHAVSWQYDKAGHVLLDKATEGTAVASVVGQVVDHRLFCGPSGNFLSREFGSLKKAKLQVSLQDLTCSLPSPPISTRSSMNSEKYKVKLRRSPTAET